MKYDPKVAQEVSATLGRPLPSPQSQAFDTLLHELDRDNPPLADKLRGALVHETLGDMETQARRQNAGEFRRQRLTHVLFQRRSELDGKLHTSKIKLVAWGSLIPLLFFGSFFLGPTLVGSAEPPVTEAAPVPTVEPAVALTATPQDEDPFQGQPEVVSRNRRVSDTVAGSQNPNAPTQEESATEEPLSAVDFGIDDAAPSASVQEQPSPQATGEPVAASPMLGGDPQLPMTSETEDPGLGVYRASAADSNADPGLAVYRAGGDASVTVTQAASEDPFAQSEDADGDGPVGLAAYRRAEPQEETPGGLQAFTQEPSPEAELQAYAQAPPQGQAAADSNPLAMNAAAEQNAYLTSGVAFTSGNNAPADGGEPYAVGDSLDATLQTGVVALGDAPLPVLARAADGSIWQGQATLTPTGRIDLSFSEVLTEGGQYPVTAVGQSGDGYLGLQAEVSETTPALASDLARGALRGLSDYVQALGDQTEVRLEGGTPIISRDAPPLEASIAGSVAQLFTPPEGDEQQALVRLAQVPADTKLKIVVLAHEPEAP